MTLYEQWAEVQDLEQDDPKYQEFWTEYLTTEEKNYQKILAAKEPIIQGTVGELAQKLNVSQPWTIGFIEGISESLKSEPPKVEDLEENTTVCLEIDFEKLFYNMVKAPNQNLMNFPEWEEILSIEKRRELQKACKTRNTIVNTEKIGRNDPCSCGSGKKYKKCCGKNA